MAKSKIIKDLANGTVDTLTALKRTKVLISEIDCPEIMSWLNHEISGYPQNTKLPDYRSTYGNLVGSYFKGSMAAHMTYKNVSLPLGKMPKDTQDVLLSLDFRESISALRELAASVQAEGGRLAKVISADFFPTIALYNNDPYMMITSARVEFGAHIIDNIFSAVENRLLDTLLLLEREFGNLDDLDLDTSEKTPEQLKALSEKMMIIIFNDNSITVGDGNKIKGSEISTS